MIAALHLFRRRLAAPGIAGGLARLLVALPLSAALVLGQPARAATGDFADIPALKSHVTDTTGTLSTSDIANIDATLRGFEQKKGTQIAVLMVPTTQPEPIEQYSLRVAEAWKVGRKGVDDGALLVVAKNDRKLRIEVGYGLEGALNDATSRRIIAEVISPKFRTGDFAGGIAAGVDKMIAVAGAKRFLRRRRSASAVPDRPISLPISSPSRSSPPSLSAECCGRCWAALSAPA